MCALALATGATLARAAPPSDEAIGITPAEPDAGGTWKHRVRSPYQAGVTEIRVLVPQRLDAVKPCRLLLVLPVEAGRETKYGDGLSEVRRHDLHNAHSLICVAPTFSHLPWYGDHPHDPHIRQETYLLEVVLPFVRRQYPVREGAENCLLLGFSKSGWGAVSLLVRHGEVFGRAAAWDAPLLETEPRKYGLPTVYPTQESFDAYRLDAALPRAAAGLQGPPRIGLFGYGNFRQHHLAAHQLLEQLGIAHEHRDGPEREHTWSSGWVPEAVEFLTRARQRG